MRIDTEIQHFGDDRKRPASPVAPPIFRTSLFTFPDCASFQRAFSGAGGEPIYTRVSNPTTRVLEEKIARLEGTGDGLAFASGMAAVSATLLGLLELGDHVVMLASAYGPTLAFARGLLARFGIDVTFVEASDFADLESHLTDRTRLIYVESPASLTFDIVDLAGIAAVARSRRIATVVDNSWATPVYQQPCRLGIDVSLHSGTKYISGHSDILLGVVAGSPEAVAKIRVTSILLGGTLSPEDAFLAIRGLRTLSLRMTRHQETGLAIARFLETQPAVSRVLHPGLESFPDHELAKKQLTGWSGLFSFELDGDPQRFADALDVFEIGVSWGGFESLVLPVDLLIAEKHLRGDLPPGLIRLSVGLEDPGDLIEDLKRGLAAATSAP